MASAEFNKALFRGQLDGATGVVDFKLEASAINVVDTIHIKQGAVAYSQFFSFSRSVSTNGTLFQANASILDSSAYLEVTTYSNRLKGIQVGGTWQNRHNAISNAYVFPVTVLVPLNRGTHGIRLTANSSGSASGWLRLRYLRRTGE